VSVWHNRDCFICGFIVSFAPSSLHRVLQDYKFSTPACPYSFALTYSLMSSAALHSVTFDLGQAWRTFLRALAQFADNFWRKPFTRGNLSLPVQCWQLFQWHLGSPCRLAPRTASRLARPLGRPWL